MPLQRITSPANPKLKTALRLRESRYRRRVGQFLVDGERELTRALQANLELTHLFVSETALSHASSAVGTIQDLLRGADPDSFEDKPKWSDPNWDPTLLALPAHLLEKLSYGQREARIIGQFATPARDLTTLPKLRRPCVLVLDRIEKPGNIGAILRTADATGCDAILICDSSGDLFHPNVIRASSGVVFSLPIALCNHEEASKFLDSLKIHLVSTEVTATIAPWDVDWTQPVGLLVGNEAEGISAFWQAQADQATRIPMLGKADSLNASISVAVCLYEGLRQRSQNRNQPN